jgi:hypothetical protein
MDICDLCNYDFSILENNILEKNETFLIDLFRVFKTNHNNIDLIEYLNNFSLNITDKVPILNILLDIIKRLNKNDKFNLIKLIWSCSGFRQIVNDINIFAYINEPYAFYDVVNVKKYVLVHNDIIEDNNINISFLEKLINNNIALTYENPLDYHIKPNNIEQCFIIFNLLINYEKNNSQKILFINGVKTFYLFFCECLYNAEKDVDRSIELNIDYDTLLEMNNTMEHLKILMDTIDRHYVDNKIMEYLFDFDSDNLDRILSCIGYGKIKFNKKSTIIYKILKDNFPIHIKFNASKLLLVNDNEINEYLIQDTEMIVLKKYIIEDIQKIKDINNNHLIDIFLNLTYLIINDNELLEHYVIKFCELLEHYLHIKNHYNTDIQIIKTDIENLEMSLKVIIMTIHKLGRIGLSYINDIIEWSKNIFDNYDLITEYIVDKYEYIIVSQEIKELIGENNDKIRVIENELLIDAISYQTVINPYFIKSGDNYNLIDRKTMMMISYSKINPFTREYIDRKLLEEFNNNLDIIVMRQEKEKLLT